VSPSACQRLYSKAEIADRPQRRARHRFLRFASDPLGQSVASPSYDCAAMIGQQRGALSAVTRVIALVGAIASATLGVYCAVLVYAAATFEHDSLPGPAVLFMVAVGVGLAAVLAGGLSHVLWRVSKRQVASARPAGRLGHEG
jgi:hypothetical protein